MQTARFVSLLLVAAFIMAISAVYAPPRYE